MTAILQEHEGVKIAFIPRQEFFDQHRWQYVDGQHVTILSPTGWGKSTLLFQLLEITATPRRPVFYMVNKPRDKTSTQWQKKLGYKRVATWPPGPLASLLGKPPGYMVWPKHVFDPDLDDYHLWQVFRTLIANRYRKGNSILAADDAEELCDLRLDSDLKTVLRNGRSMGTGLWLASQRPVEVPRLAYSGCTHLFLGNNADADDRKRYRDIGGLRPGYDTRLIERVTLSLPEYHWLYIRRRPFAMCIIGP